MESDDGTYIRVKKSTRERLGNIGTKKDSYDSVINMLIDQYIAKN